METFVNGDRNDVNGGDTSNMTTLYKENEMKIKDFVENLLWTFNFLQYKAFEIFVLLNNY